MNEKKLIEIVFTKASSKSNFNYIIYKNVSLIKTKVPSLRKKCWEQWCETGHYIESVIDLDGVVKLNFNGIKICQLWK